MPPRDTGKQRAARIPLDYYKRPNAMERWKGLFALLALLATVGVTAAAWVMADGGRPFISRGPVASVHAAWDNSCETCHADFHPIGKNSVLAFLGPAGSAESASNLRCEQCHQGTEHHQNQLVSMTPGCGGCHRDHRGREASLVALPDSDCTQCHSNLKASTKDGKSEYEKAANIITGFGDGSQGHPDFPSLEKDPGRLKFNHALHMRPGQVIAADQVKPWTLGRIADKATRERYASAPWQADKSDGATVVLDCASCHRLDAGDLGIDPAKKPAGVSAAALAPRAAGAYMLPINYDVHCAACHPLTFDPNVKDKDGQAVSVPHRLQPDAVKDFVWGAYAEAFLKKNADQPVADALKAGPKPSRPLPGKLTEAEQAARESVGKDTAQAEDFLFQKEVKRTDGYLYKGKTTCGECHVYDTAGGAMKIQPVMVNSVWLAHSKFSHVSHRAADCRICHPNAYAFDADGKTANPKASVDHKDVLILGIGSCRQCHSPSAGVRSDCTECHYYHNGDRSLQGLGAAARDPHEPGKDPFKDMPHRFGDVGQFLKGNRN